MEKEASINQANQEWTEIISPKVKWYDLKLKEVWRYRDLLVLFVRRDFVATYKQTVLGPFWHFIQPIFTTITFFFIFGRIAKIPTDGIPGVAFYMSSLTIWNYFVSCFMGTANTFRGNAGIFGKVYFPRLVSPLSTIISSMFRLGVQLTLLTAVLIYLHVSGTYKISWHIGWIWFLPLIIIVGLLGLSLGIIVSSLTTKYRDFQVMMGFGIQLLMYLTPIVYPLSYVSDKRLETIIKINPITHVVESFRYILFNTNPPEMGSIVYLIVFVSFAFLLGTILFNMIEKSFMDTV